MARENTGKAWRYGWRGGDVDTLALNVISYNRYIRSIFMAQLRRHSEFYWTCHPPSYYDTPLGCYF